MWFQSLGFEKRENTMKRIFRKSTPEELSLDAKVIAAEKQAHPEAFGRGLKPSPPGIPSRIRAAREARGLTWYAVAKAAGIPNSGTIRDIEQGRDVRLSSLRAVAEVLGLQLDLVETAAN